MKALIHVTPSWSKLEGCSPNGKRAVKEALSVLMPGAQFSKAFKYGGWDGKIPFYNPISGSFPTGLVKRVTSVLRVAGDSVQLSILGNVPRPIPLTPSLASSLVQREYQEKTTRLALKNGRATFLVGTSGGKTYIGADIIRAFGLKTLWIINRKQLAKQTRDELSQFLGMKIGMVGGGEKTILPVTVGIAQSLVNIDKRDPFWAYWEMGIADECHTVTTADTWYDVMMRLTNAWRRFGLSGTPKTRNAVKNMKLEAATGPVIDIINVADLVDQDFLARPEIRLIRAPKDSFPTVTEARDALFPDWRQNTLVLQKGGASVFAWIYERGIVHNKQRNARFIQKALLHYRRGEKVLILASRIDHVDLIYNLLLKRVDRVWYGHSHCSDNHRDEALLRFRNSSEGGIMVAGKIFDFGMDIPEIDAMMQLGGGEDPIAIDQRLGRALRRREDKTRVPYYDGWDGQNPAAPDPKDYLGVHSASRKAQYEMKRFTVKILE